MKVICSRVRRSNDHTMYKTDKRITYQKLEKINTVSIRLSLRTLWPPVQLNALQ